jgi:hypothetical protein
MKGLSVVPALMLAAGLVGAQDKPPEASAKQENSEAAIIPVKRLTGGFLRPAVESARCVQRPLRGEHFLFFHSPSVQADERVAIASSS